MTFNDTLGEPLHLLRHIPLLEIVDQSNVEDLAAICRLNLVPLTVVERFELALEMLAVFDMELSPAALR